MMRESGINERAPYSNEMIELNIYQLSEYILRYMGSRLHPHLYALFNPLAVMVAHETDGPIKVMSLSSEHRDTHLQMTLMNKDKHNNKSKFLFYDVQFQDIDKTNKLYTRGRKGNNKLHQRRHHPSTSQFQSWLSDYGPRYIVPSSSRALLGGVEDVATSDLSLVHHVEDLGQLRETDGLEGSLDQALTVELDGFGGISAVADVGALDGDHSYDRLEDGSLEEGTCGQTDADDGTTRADVLCCVRL